MEAALAAADALGDSVHESPTERQSFPPIWQRTLLGEPQRDSGRSDRGRANSADRRDTSRSEGPSERSDNPSERLDNPSRRSDRASERSDRPIERSARASERSDKSTERSVRSVTLAREVKSLESQSAPKSAQQTKILAAVAASACTVLILLTVRPHFSLDASRRTRWEVVLLLGIVCGIATYFISEGLGA